MARRWKYLLGPSRSAVAAYTEPSGSTMTRTHTLICPMMVRRAPSEASGISTCSVAGDVASAPRPGFAGITAELGFRTPATTGPVVSVICASGLCGAGSGAGVPCDPSMRTPVQARAMTTIPASNALSKTRGLGDCAMDDADFVVARSAAGRVIRTDVGSGTVGSGTVGSDTTIAAG